jgi:glycosyltransferase involved in cell wall biosynthesis
MTIAIVTHRVVQGDGQGRVNHAIAEAAVRRGHRVVLVASEADPALVERSGVSWVPILVGGLPTALLRNQAFAWRSTRWLRAHRAQLDCVLANGSITWAAADVNVSHFVHTAWLRSAAHTSRLQRGPYGWYQWLYSWLNAQWERHAYRQARTVVAVSETVRDELGALGVPPDTIVTIPNGVDIAEFHPPRPDPAAEDRTPFGLPANVPVGLFIGDLRTPRKNLDTVLRALQQVPLLHLAVAGSTADSPYPALARTLGLSSRVHFLGYCDAVPQLMRAVDICLCPSRYEPFSMVALESLASGTPVLTSRNVGAAKLLTPDCAWILDDPEDDAALAEALRDLLEKLSHHPDKIASMKSAARALAEGYSFAHMAAHYLRVIEETYVHPPAPAVSRHA